MKTMMYQFRITTHQKDEMLDITDKIHECIKQSGIEDGQCFVFVPHTTAAVTVNENTDPDVKRDMLYELNRIVPHEDGYMHVEGNSAAHIKASMFGNSEQFILSEGRLILGRWQSVYFCEFDGPRTRQCYVKILG